MGGRERERLELKLGLFALCAWAMLGTSPQIILSSFVPLPTNRFIAPRAHAALDLASRPAPACLSVFSMPSPVVQIHNTLYSKNTTNTAQQIHSQRDNKKTHHNHNTITKRKKMAMALPGFRPTTRQGQCFGQFNHHLPTALRISGPVGVNSSPIEQANKRARQDKVGSNRPTH